MTDDQIAGLLKRLREGKCTDEEIDKLNSWYHNLKGGRADFEVWLGEAGGKEQLTGQLFVRFNQRMIGKQKKQNRQIWYRSVAAILIVLTTSIVFIQKQKMQSNDLKGAIAKKITAPGTNKATLILADGTKIDLNNANNGFVANQLGFKVKKTADDKLIYEPRGTGVVGGGRNKLLYNTITTPRAGQYEVELSDGTRVWLNAETTLKYPVRFTAGERKVELTGEAYFEVAHNKTLPFRVATAEQTITVLGTHFNIKGYMDEQTIATTLIEGSVSVFDRISGQNEILVPGKQANIKRGDGVISIADASIDEVMAWKNGYFVFDNQDIKDVMRLVSRWYDVDVDFKLSKSVRFGGTFSKSSDLKELLKNFALLGNLHFELKERRITVSN
jgi:ferric-dicitrate binding protein FerR (iron transport regulator)